MNKASDIVASSQDQELLKLEKSTIRLLNQGKLSQGFGEKVIKCITNSADTVTKLRSTERACEDWKRAFEQLSNQELKIAFIILWRHLKKVVKKFDRG